MTSALTKLIKTEELFQAIKNRNYNYAKQLLHEGANPNRLLLNGVTPLHLAIAAESTSSYEYVKLLLEYRGNPNVCDADGITPLHVAAQWDKADCFSLLLENGADMNIADRDGRDAEWFAQDSRHCKLIIDEYLQAKHDENYDANIGYYSETSTHVPCNNNAETQDIEADTSSIHEHKFNRSNCDSSPKSISKMTNSNSALSTITNTTFCHSKKVLKRHNSSERSSANHCHAAKESSMRHDSSGRYILDATSPDHCFFTYKTKKKDAECAENFNDTLLMTTQCNRILSDSMRSNDHQCFPSKETDSTLPLTPAAVCEEDASSTNETSSICTFADSTIPVTDLSFEFDLQTKPNESDSSSLNLSDEICRKMLLATKYNGNINKSIIPDEGKPLTDFHSNESISSENISVSSDSSCKITPKTCSIEESTPTTDYVNHNDKPTAGTEDEESLRQGIEILQISSSSCNQNSLSLNSVTSITTAYYSLTSTDPCDSSLPIKLSLSFSNRSETEDTIIYDWQSLTDYSSCEECDSSSSESFSIPSRIENLSDKDLRKELTKHGVSPGPVKHGRKQYEKRLYLLEQGKTFSSAAASTFSRELETLLRGGALPRSVVEDDEDLRKEFDDPVQSTRGGTAKDSFNYLLLDPRITKDLPERAKSLSELEVLKIFAGAAFYVGKGKRSRPYAHLKEALGNKKNGNKQKIQHIRDIWRSDGVVSLHVFQNALACEAFTREAAMIEAFGLDHLTNHVRGKCYGAAQSWHPVRLRQYGCFLIIRAMQMLLLEGERQIRPHQISNKSTK